MNLITKWSYKRGARRDAHSDLQSADDRIVAELGPRPKFDPVANPEHGEFSRVLGERVRIEELREDITRADDVSAGRAPPLAFTLGLVVAVAVEVLGAILIMRVLGVPPSERLPLGLALAVTLIGITGATAHRTSERRATPGRDSAVPQAHKRSASTAIILAGYTAVVLAIAVVRVRSSADEESSQLEIVAQSLLMLATSIGPAWISEWLVRNRSPAAASHKLSRLLRTRLRDAERAQARAQAAVNQITRAGARWDIEAAQRRALYTTHHRLENAKGAT